MRGASDSDPSSLETSDSQASGLPHLWTFRRCPYAIRARLAIEVAQVEVEYREVVLRDKPARLLIESPKATVPVLALKPGAAGSELRVIDESIDIMRWALAQNDPEAWLGRSDEESRTIAGWIEANDVGFKPDLDKYKYWNRHPEATREATESRCETHLGRLNEVLERQPYLVGERFSLADAALVPFVRQFHFCDEEKLQSWGFIALRRWLFDVLESERFLRVMTKREQWIDPAEEATPAVLETDAEPELTTDAD